MKWTLLCQVVDNFGDAGVTLRLAKQLVREHQQEVHIHTDDPSAFETLEQCARMPEGIFLHKGLTPPATDIGEVVIEMFGTPLHPACIADLSQRRPAPVWIVLDYLSAEAWTETVHGLSSVDPRTGMQRWFFYPGFSNKTGGLLIEADRCAPNPAPTPGQIFVFAYPQAPIAELMTAVGHAWQLCVAAPINEHTVPHQRIPFVPQDHFDDVLARHEWLFVRGEDSFVRAQLAGRPFVWMIYPTPDGAHWEKLQAFFDVYTQTLSSLARERLWALWRWWNGASDTEAPTQLWAAVLEHQADLVKNALEWKSKLTSGRRLVGEILTFVHSKTRN